MKKKVIFFGKIFLAISLVYILLIIYPNLILSYKYEYKNFRIYSDKEIPNSIETVMDRASLSLKKSELYKPNYVFNIIICQNENLFAFFTRNKHAGGVVQGLISTNVFIRESNINQNKIIPPGGWMYDIDERPLSYFIAHELTHSLQSIYDRFMIFKVPWFVMEGYADYIGKNEYFNYKDYRQLLIENHPKMRNSSPLYNRYHLYIWYLIEKKNFSFRDIIKNIPDLDKTLEEIRMSVN